MTQPAIQLPYTRECFVCGEHNSHGLKLRLVYQDGAAFVRLHTGPHLCGYRDRVHGGLLMTLVDEVMGWAAACEKHRMCVSGEITTRFKRPVPIGEDIMVRGRLVEDRRLFWRCEATVENDAGELFVEARGVYVPMTHEQSVRIENETLIYPPDTDKIFDLPR